MTFYATYLVALFGAMFCMLIWITVRDMDNIDKLKKDRKEMVILLGSIYLDIDQHNGKVMNDTRREIERWAKDTK